MTAIAIDPTTLDYAIGNGAPVRDGTGGLMNAIVLRILTPLGTYWFDPTIGSQLYLLRRAKNVTNIVQIAEQYVEQALQPLIADGRATAIAITSQQPQNGWLYLFVKVTAANGQIVTFTHPVQVFGP